MSDLSKERLAELLARAKARDEAHRGGYEPEALCDDDILTLLDIREIHEGAQAFRGDRAGRSMREVAEFEVVVSRSEYVCMAEALLRAAEERDRLRSRLDALVAVGKTVVARSREIEWVEPNEGGLRQRAMESTVGDIVALREAIRAVEENQ